MAKYRLKLKRLDWISPVDEPAQQTARILLVKRNKLSGFARAVKVSDELGLVFCWAFTSKSDGEDYYDLQSDNIDEDFIKAAMEFMERGGPTDEMHDGRADGRVVFAMPLTAQVAKAFGIKTDTTGLMVALKPSPDVFEKFKSGEYTGVSIEGIGEREKVARKSTDQTDDSDDTTSGYKCADCGQYMKADQTACKDCGGSPMPYKRAPGATVKAEWSTATVDDLPDSSFLYIEPGGKKDDDDKTTPRSLRHFPYRDENGKVDLPHLRNAIARIPQSSLPATLRNKLQAKAEKLLGKQHADAKRAFAKHAYLTTSVDGHTHLLDHDRGQAADYTDYAESSGGVIHCHPWVRNSDDDTFVIGESAGHAHEVVAQQQIDTLAESGDADVDEDAADNMGTKRNSTPRAVMPHGERTTEKSMPDAKDNEITELKAKLEKRDAKIARLEKKLDLTDAQHRHYKTLASDEAKDAFLAKSHADRDELVKAAIVYTSKSDGSVFFASDDPRLVEMAKRDDEKTQRIEKAEREAQQVKLEKRADVELAHLGKSASVRAAILRAVDGIADEATRKAAHEALKGANAFMAESAKFNAGRRLIPETVVLPDNGVGGEATDKPPVIKAQDALEKRVREYQAEHKIETYEQAYTKALASDPKARELYGAVRGN